MDTTAFLPVSQRDLRERGMQQLDFILVSADAYVDHPSFASALLGRYLEAFGYQVGILAQPNFGDVRAFQALGRPRLAFLVSGGNMDSMVNRYTANKRRRSQDLYSPGGRCARPDRVSQVYVNMLKKAYPDVPIVLGGVEGSLRRFAHYDYWSDQVRPPILEEAPADLLVYGMGEKPLLELAEALDAGLDIKDITYIRGTAYLAKDDSRVYEEKVLLPSYEEVAKDKHKFAQAFFLEYREQDPIKGRVLVQPVGDRVLVQNPPAQQLTRDELDFVYSLPYTREAHPSYREPIPALQEVKFSLVSSRGCFGGCSFCSIFFHQGRYVTSRSVESLEEEAKRLTALPDFKGYIHDVGGPTANFTHPPCDKAEKEGMCLRRCLAPKPCPRMNASHDHYIKVLRRLRKVPGVKKVFVRSGVRFDYAMAEPGRHFIRELAAHHTSGQLKVAPEHCAKEVLDLMGKGDIRVFDEFREAFLQASKKAGKKQYVLPYFIASHPGCTLRHAVALAEYLKKHGFVPDQVQDFYPTPGSISTCMYYTGLDPLTMKKVYIPKSQEERAMQRALLQFHKPENAALVKKALIKAGRTDLIGRHPGALIRG